MGWFRCHTSPVDWTLQDIADATGGVVLGADGHEVVTDLVIDSRSMTDGALFVPIVAERDGHDFVPTAMAAGAGAHLTHRDDVSDGPAVRVADTTAALEAIGVAARARLSGAVVGITGSVGKTTAKDLAAAALAAVGPTHASYRSFNNELGVPLTLANAPADAHHVILEMGARGQGHIAHLCRVASPTIGAVLAVGAAHTEMFGDLDGVAEAKGELVESLPSSGTAVLNNADFRVAAMASRTPARVLTFGADGDVRASGVVLDDQLRPSFTVECPWGSAAVALPAAGLHAVPNALAALAIGLAAGAGLEALVRGLSAAELSPWRMEVVTAASGARIINDAYNANPMSMHAAIDALLGVEAGRRVAVVGVMAELGPDGAAEHRRVGERLAAAGVDVVSLDTPEYGGIAVSSVEEAAAAVGATDSTTVVLVKGSRVAGLEAVVPLIG